MLTQDEDLFSLYLAMIGKTEAPIIYHRWSFLTMIGAWLGRGYYLPFGDGRINCNMYVMLLGNAGARKTTAIKTAVKLLREAGYNNIAANKTSKEKFLLDLAGEDLETPVDENALVSRNIFGINPDEDSEILIAADEFNVFVGNGNIEFLSLLGDLWDYNGVYENKVKNSKSAYINNPTISILSGNTAQSFSLGFPIEAIGQGIFSRLLIIGGKKTGTRLTIPPAPDIEIRKIILDAMQVMKQNKGVAMELAPAAYKLLDKIYHHHPPIHDARFESYSNRRLTHLIKLSIIHAVCRLEVSISEEDVLKANTILTYAEHLMPSALGEFGKSADSDITNKIVSLLEESPVPLLDMKAIWAHVYNDLAKPDDLRSIMSKLIYAGRVTAVDHKFVANSKYLKITGKEVDLNILTEEERKDVSI